MTRTSADGTKQVLVFSDEFNKDGRTFYDGDDPFFQAVDIWYGATQDLEVKHVESCKSYPVLTRVSGMILMPHILKMARSTWNSQNIGIMAWTTDLA